MPDAGSDLPPTERRNPRTRELDTLPTAELVRLLTDEELAVAPAVARAAPELTRLVDLAVTVLSHGGRVHYAGAGTSGRLATLDAAELRGTYGVPDDVFIVHHAGAPASLGITVQDAEDDTALGVTDLAAVRPVDLVVGVSASGRTPYVLAALDTARRAGAHTALVSAHPAAPAGAEVDVHVAVDTGPEPITGSTRMKAATAHKMLLTTFSTAVMVRLGYTWSNLMVGVIATNAKLRRRALSVLTDATGLDEAACAEALAQADGDLRTALVSLLAGVPTTDAARVLAQRSGRVRDALSALQPEPA